MCSKMYFIFRVTLSIYSLSLFLCVWVNRRRGKTEIPTMWSASFQEIPLHLTAYLSSIWRWRGFIRSQTMIQYIFLSSFKNSRTDPDLHLVLCWPLTFTYPSRSCSISETLHFICPALWLCSALVCLQDLWMNWWTKAWQSFLSHWCVCVCVDGWNFLWKDVWFPMLTQLGCEAIWENTLCYREY